MQHKIYWGGLKNWIEWSLKTWMAPWAYVASIAYHDYYWLPFVGKQRVHEALGSEWGRLFQHWEKLTPDESGFSDIPEAPAEVTRLAG
jgi:hypothetical protein